MDVVEVDTRQLEDVMKSVAGNEPDGSTDSVYTDSPIAISRSRSNIQGQYWAV